MKSVYQKNQLLRLMNSVRTDLVKKSIKGNRPTDGTRGRARVTRLRDHGATTPTDVFLRQGSQWSQSGDAPSLRLGQGYPRSL